MEITAKEMILIISALKDAHERVLGNKELYEDPEREAKEILDLHNKLLMED
ncbi:MAG: hypothetical protein ABRQ27_04380 [Clostridiaceae bacterium]